MTLFATATANDQRDAPEVFCAAVQSAERSAEFRALEPRVQADLWGAVLLGSGCALDESLVLDVVFRLQPALEAACEAEIADSLRERALLRLSAGQRVRLLFRLARAAERDDQWTEKRALAERGLAACRPGLAHHPWRVALRNLIQSAYLAAGLVDRADQEQVRLDALFADWRAQPLDAAELRTLQATWIQAVPSHAELLATQDDYDGVVRLTDEVERLVGGVDRVEFPAQLLLARGVAECNLERADPSRPRRAAESLRAYVRNTTVTEPERGKARLRLIRMALDARDFVTAQAEIDACWLGSASSRAGPIANWRARDYAWLCALSLDLAHLVSDHESERCARDRLNAAWNAVVEAWREDTPPAGGASRLHYENARHALCSLVRSTRRLAGDEAAARLGLEQMIRVQECGWLARELEAGGGDVESLQSRLCGDRGGLLVYLPGPVVSYVFAVDRERITLHDLASRDEIEPRRRAVRIALWSEGDASAARTAQIQASSRELADVLLPPAVESRIAGWRSLDVQGLDLLQDLPFELLPLSDGRPLGIVKEVGTWPSLPAALVLAQRAHDRSAEPNSGAKPLPLELLVLASPSAPAIEEGPGAGLPLLPPLTSDRRERWEALYASAGPARPASRVLQASEATLARLSAEVACAPRILLIMAHGIHDPESDRPSGILLAADETHDGRWWCRDIDVRARLVILGVCSAGRGPTRRGDGGSSSLEGAFLRSDADCVLIGSAELELQGALELFDGLHERLTAGASPAAALRAVRAERFARLGLGDPLWRALLRVSGAAHTPLYPVRTDSTRAPGRARDPWPLIAGGLLALAVAGLVAWVARNARR